MKSKRLKSIALAMVFIMSAVAGCSSSKSQDKTTSSDAVSMGRYLELELDYPSGLNGENITLNIINVQVNPEGILELYAFEPDFTITKYVQQDGVWRKEKFRMNTPLALLSVPTIFYGEDKNLYILLAASDDRYALYGVSNDGTIKKALDIKSEDKYFVETEKVLENGMVAAMFRDKSIKLYSPGGESVVYEPPTNNSQLMAVDGNHLYYTDPDGKALFCYNADTKQEEPSQSLGKGLLSNSLLSVENGILYLYDSEGFHLMQKKSAIWETVIDERHDSELEPEDFIYGGDNNFYLSLSDKIAGLKIVNHIYFDKSIPAVPSSELTIYSIENEPAIGEAVRKFETRHTDVDVNYRIAGEGSGTATAEDMIRGLNTEILAEKGPDIIVLDGLPIDSYIEKGVLEDMGDIFLPKLEAGELVTNIAQHYVEDNKVYAMPAWFKVPIIYGPEKLVSAATSVKNLAQYAEKQSEVPIFAPCNYKELVSWMLYFDKQKIMNGKNVFIDKNYIEFLENVNSISQNIKASNDVAEQTEARNKGCWVKSVLDVYYGDAQANMEMIGHFDEMTCPLVATKQRECIYATVKNLYEANTLVGINSGSTQKNLAKEFIQLLFSEEMQQKELGTGFPISQMVCNQQINYVNLKWSISTGIAYNYDRYIMDTIPNSSEKSEIFDRISLLTTPIDNDSIIDSILTKEAVRCLMGDITPEDAARNVASHIKIYLAE